MSVAENRKILVFAHTGRKEARDAARHACKQLHHAGLVPVMNRSDLETLMENWDDPVPVQVVHESVALIDIELGMVLGGDGSILRAAEMVRHTSIPLIGVNLGHVGFLAESEESDLQETVERIVKSEYTVEERMAIDIEVWHEEKRVHTDWALNEVSVEKGNREKMIEVIIEVDRKPISTFGCDGVVIGTPTGSTAYAFSGGGPVVWPEVEAILLVPLSAHALFARPLVASPSSMVAVEMMAGHGASGVMWCDGRRMIDLLPGSRVETRKSDKPVLLARIHPAPFSERLVRKFALPIRGWRGPTSEEEHQAYGTEAEQTAED